jgi:hypothetical protein
MISISRFTVKLTSEPKYRKREMPSKSIIESPEIRTPTLVWALALNYQSLAQKREYKLIAMIHNLEMRKLNSRQL